MFSTLIVLSVIIAGAVGVFFYLKNKKEIPLPPDLENIRYGPNPRNVLDVWLPKDKPNGKLPVIVYIHGGGFKRGEKELLPLQRRMLNAKNPCIAISINYTYAFNGVDSQAHIKECFEDAYQAINFIAANAEKINADPERIMVSGVSAGGMIALWLGAYMSGRIKAVWVWGTMVSLNPYWVVENVGGNLQVFKDFGLEKMFHLNSLEELKDNEFVEKLSPIYNIHPHSAPVFAQGYPYAGKLPPNTGFDALVHSAGHMVVMSKELKQAGIDCEVYWEGNNPDGGIEAAEDRFIATHLSI